MKWLPKSLLSGTLEDEPFWQQGIGIIAVRIEEFERMVTHITG
ncbi:hypothetical protein Holit_01719 [Hollandina sp. SP2]